MIDMQTSIVRGAVALLITVLVAGCSGDPAQPTPPSDPALTITIDRNGATPRALTVARGSQITFVNNDSITHQMYSDPHPEHTDCPEFDTVGSLAPGARRQTTNLVTAGTCQFHDHLNFLNTTLRGVVTIR